MNYFEQPEDNIIGQEAVNMGRSKKSINNSEEISDNATVRIGHNADSNFFREKSAADLRPNDLLK